MKNLRQNILILGIAFCFLTFGFTVSSAGLQTKNAKAKPTPTPKTKKSPTPTPKTAKKTPDKNTKTKNASTPKVTKNTDKTNKKISAEKDKKQVKGVVDKKTDKTKKSEQNAKTKTKTEVKKVTKQPKEIKPKPVKKEIVKTAPKPTTKVPTQSFTKLNDRSLIVSNLSVPVFIEPDADSEMSGKIRLGTKLQVIENNSNWFKITYLDENKPINGWVENNNVIDFTTQNRDRIYQKISDKYFNNLTLNFAAASELFDFLTISQKEITDEKLLAEFGLQRLLILKVALKEIPNDKMRENPYSTFLKDNENEIVFSDPAGEWFVRLDIFWNLHNRHKNLPIADEIAWQAANISFAEECEGYINCYIYKLRATFGEYLNFYPEGKHYKQASAEIFDLLKKLSNIENRKNYTAPSDISDRAEFNKMLNELRMIISKVPQLDKTKSIQQINQVAEIYR